MSDRLARISSVAMFVAIISSVLATSMLTRAPASAGPQHASDDGHAIENVSADAPGIRDFVLPGGLDTGPRHLIRVLITADEEFIAKAGPGWRDEATNIASGASELLAQIGVGITVVGVKRWDSPDEVRDLVQLFDEASLQSRNPSGAVMLSLTSQRTDIYDGWARALPPGMLMRVTVPPLSTTPSLISHEFGHILGLTHHEDGHDCPLGGCLMDEKGYAHASKWCDHHKEEIAGILAGI